MTFDQKLSLMGVCPEGCIVDKDTGYLICSKDRAPIPQQPQIVVSHAPCASFDTCTESIKSCCCSGLPVCYKTATVQHVTSISSRAVICSPVVCDYCERDYERVGMSCADCIADGHNKFKGRKLTAC